LIDEFLLANILARSIYKHALESKLLGQIGRAEVEIEMQKPVTTITNEKKHLLTDREQPVALPITLSNTGKTLMDKIRAIAVDIQSHQNNILDLDTTQSEAYAQSITYTIIITTVATAAITSVLVYAINRGIHRRHLAVQRSLQTEVEKRTGQLQVANNQLLVANEQLKLHDRIQQEFINVAAHELRTPIQPILSLTQIPHSNIKDSQQQESLDIVIRNAKRLKKLSDDLLYITDT
jgi:signal transduction histidine kinase